MEMQVHLITYFQEPFKYFISLLILNESQRLQGSWSGRRRTLKASRCLGVGPRREMKAESQAPLGTNAFT